MTKARKWGYVKWRKRQTNDMPGTVSLCPAHPLKAISYPFLDAERSRGRGRREACATDTRRGDSDLFQHRLDSAWSLLCLRCYRDTC